MTAYDAWGRTGPALAAVFLHEQRPLADPVAELIAAGARTPVDPAHEADLLVGGLGLWLDLLHRRRSRADVRCVLDYHLARILP